MVHTKARGYIDETYQARSRNRALQREVERLRSLGSHILEGEGGAGEMRINTLVHLLETALSNPESIDITVLTEYIMELTRLMNNAGDGVDFLDKFDDAIAFYRRAGQSITDLCIAKFRYLSLTANEGEQFESLLETAQQEAKTPEELLRVLLVLADYQTAISLYNESIATCHKCETLIDEHPCLESYRPAVLTSLGVNYFTSFSDLVLAKEYLEQGRKLAQQYRGNPRVLRSLASTLHYLGRVYEVQDQYAEAMQYYIDGQICQDQCPEELGATAFYHLRLGELLIAMQIPHHALNHLMLSQQLFRKTRNRGTGDIQIEFAIAAYYVSQSQNEDAERTIQRAIEDSRTRKYVRGELLCLGYLFFFYLKRMRIDRAFLTGTHVLQTLRSGELRRNNIAVMFRRLPTLLKILFRRLRARPRTSPVGTNTRPSQRISACQCPMHQKG